jgi:hypothetical protein
MFTSPLSFHAATERSFIISFTSKSLHTREPISTFVFFAICFFVFDKRSNNMRAQYVGHIILVLNFSNHSPWRRSRDYAAERAAGLDRWQDERWIRRRQARSPCEGGKFRGRHTSVSQAYRRSILRKPRDRHGLQFRALGVLFFLYQFLLIREWSGGFLRYPVYLLLILLFATFCRL